MAGREVGHVESSAEQEGSSPSALPTGTLLELRVGSAALLGTSGVRSAIHKDAQQEPRYIGYDGLVGDQQTESFHGGRERAVLQYDVDHYQQWRAELGDLGGVLVPGGFGENFVVAGMSEATMCIGDVVRAGEVLLQVSEPRGPCYKLNHRFSTPDMARRTQDSRRTGWLYRVLVPGWVGPGDTVAVIGRPMPEWPVTRVQEVLYTRTDDLDAAAELATLPFLSRALRAIFWRRVENAAIEDWSSRLAGVPLEGEQSWIETEVVEIREESPTVRSILFAAADGSALPAYTAGAHVHVRIANSMVRSYSLCERDSGRGYRIAVAKAPTSRGGSAYLHERLTVGDRISLTPAVNDFPLVDGAGDHVLLAGGIGITPMRAMAETLDEVGAEWELHHCVRTRDDAAFAADLASRFPDRFRLHVSNGDPAQRVDLAALLGNRPPDTHIYCCGSTAFMESVRAASNDRTPDTLHFEAFTPPANDGDTGFTVRLGSNDGPCITIPAGTTLLQGLRDSGVELPSSCETGTCGTCCVPYLSGHVIHRDLVLTRAERTRTLAACVSRAVGTVVIDVRTGSHREQ